MENLKEKYLEIERRYWKNSQTMMKYCESKYFDAIQLQDGMLVFNKPNIETHFCYSYDEFRPDSCDNAYKQCEAVRTKFDVFLQKNLRDTIRHITALHKAIEEKNNAWEKVYIIDQYYGEKNELKSWVVENEHDIQFRFKGNVRYRLATMDELKAILNMYIEIKKYMTKRCQTYWKRYGGSKLKTWTYSMWD